MGYRLLERRNPYGDHFYRSRLEPLFAVVVHGTAGSEDLDTIGDLSAENVADYAATTSVEVSWHTGSDTDSWVNLLPTEYTAWHATDYNSCTHGHELSKRHMDWRSMPALWVEKTLRMAALGPDGKAGLRKIALDNGIPLRWATRAELDEQRANYRAGRPWRRVGFITHHEIQPADRTDPGYVREGGRLIDTFPRARFMALLNQQEEDMPLSKEDVEWVAGRVKDVLLGEPIRLVQYEGGTKSVALRGVLEFDDYRAQSTNTAVGDLAEKVDAIRVGGVDYDLLADKVADRLASRLAQ